MLPFSMPDYPRIKLVHSFEELVSTPFADGINALCWPRQLPGDFAEVLAAMPAGEGIVILEDDFLKNLQVSAAGRVALDVMLQDQRLLRERELDPVLNCIHGYPRDEDSGPVPTDVFSFHVDSAPIEAETWLCTYFGLSSDGLPNEEAQRRVDDPATRAELLKLFGGEDNEAFQEFLHDNCYDLHYVPLPGAKPYSFGIGNLWRIAAEWPGSLVLPCIHRAPATLPGQARLLLIS